MSTPRSIGFYQNIFSAVDKVVKAVRDDYLYWLGVSLWDGLRLIIWF
jgi:hypothetical protein